MGRARTATVSHPSPVSMRLFSALGPGLEGLTHASTTAPGVCPETGGKLHTLPESVGLTRW